MVTIDTNIRLEAPAQYTNYAFDSMCQHPDGFYLGANENGLFLLDGVDDNGTAIEASFTLPLDDLGSHMHKRLRFLYLGLEGNGDVLVTVSFDELDDTHEITFSIPQEHQQTGLMRPVSRAVFGRYLRLKVENVNGSVFALDSIDVVPIGLRSCLRG
ncbi:MAG: hypothetical protein RBS34_00305 [Desulfofustis sp.]|jgi:hypothetical protein|nr:hypothetical protein [Desulfofustis sp.]